jgi:hypothetical protein
VCGTIMPVHERNSAASVCQISSVTIRRPRA